MSNATISLLPIEGKGRGYIAARDINVGEIILEEKSLKSRGFAMSPGGAPPACYNDLAQQILENPALSELWFESSHPDDKSKALAQVMSNAFIVKDPNASNEEGEMYMLQVDPQGSFFNHSCWPNATSHLRPSDQITMVVAIEPIKSGDEICICYKSRLLYTPTSRRREFLKQNWNFDCNCTRCVAPRKDDLLLTTAYNLKTLDIDEMSQIYDELMAVASSLNDPKSVTKWLSKARRFMKIKLHDAHWRKISIRQYMIFFTLNPMFDQQETKKLIEDQISAYKLVGPAYHNSKVELFLTYKHCRRDSLHEEMDEIEKSCKNLDDVYEKLMGMFK